MSKYIALTFGPITRVISLARTTRGMWAASYLFSYLAKHIISKFENHSFLLPYLDSNIFKETFNGIGVFPDRYIFESNEGDFELLATEADNALNILGANIAPNNQTEATKMLKQYLKIFFFETSRNDGESDRALVERCEKQLALLEQNDSFIPSVPENKHYLSSLINCKRLEPMQFLLSDANIKQFSSIINISTGDDGFGNAILPKIPYQRYIAIVYADGDSMGEAFTKAASSHDLSQRLFVFNKEAIAAINNFGGQPVFIGGDDLFFFAPVYCPNKGSVFTLIDQLDKAFHNAVGDSCPATLSFGVSITYIKYPMSEAVELSRGLLAKAKGNNPPEGTSVLKNNVAFAVQKHSGQNRSALLHKGCTGTVTKMNHLLDTYITGGNNDDMLLVKSVMHNLREHEPILLNAITDENLLKQYFSNNYNEPKHKQFEGFFNDVCNFLINAYKDFDGKTDLLKRSLESPFKDRPEGHDSAFAAIDLCYATLQFIHLVNAPKK